MSVTAVTGSSQTLPEIAHDFRAEIKQLHESAKENPPSDPEEFRQGVKQLNSDIRALREEVNTLKSESKGGTQPITSAAPQALKDDVTDIRGDIRGLASMLGAPATSPPDGGPSPTANKVDVTA